MTTTLYVAMNDGLLTLRREGEDRWQAEEVLDGAQCRCVAVDPTLAGTVFCGTADRGLWRSRDGGRSWEPVAQDVAHVEVTAVAVGEGRDGAGGVVYAGTEPSAVFRSADGGETWEERTGLLDLPSSDAWSFPPRPETHHVRWIGIDPHVAGRLFVAIEAGALVRSRDGGRTWEDRVETGPYDTHTLVIHPRVRDRLYSAAGDGYFESEDGGERWNRLQRGLGHQYAWSCVVDPGDPGRVVVSAAEGARAAHSGLGAESWIYRKEPGGAWQPVREGLPEPRGTTISSLVLDPADPAGLYCANNRGVFHSADLGESWSQIDIPWPARFRRQRVAGLAVCR